MNYKYINEIKYVGFNCCLDIRGYNNVRFLNKIPGFQLTHFDGSFNLDGSFVYWK